MSKSLRLLLVLAMVLTVIPAAFAEHGTSGTNVNAAADTGIRNFAKRNPEWQEGADDLPPPQDPNEMAGLGVRGPVANAKTAVTSFSFGSVAPRGGTMSSAKQRADRQIQRLIRDLG